VCPNLFARVTVVVEKVFLRMKNYKNKYFLKQFGNLAQLATLNLLQDSKLPYVRL
jgi:hypothetical protein